MSKQTDPPGPGGLALARRALGTGSLAGRQQPWPKAGDCVGTSIHTKMTCRMSRSRLSKGSSSSSTVRWTARMTGKARGYQVLLPHLQAAAPKTSGNPGADRGPSITGYRSPCLLPMSTSSSWKLSGPSACEGQRSHHQAWSSSSSRSSTRPARTTVAYTPDGRAAGEPPAPRSGLCSVGSHGWTRRPHPPCREQSQELK